MFVISKRLFCMLLVGLATLAVASLCSILHVPMDKAVILFLGTWLGLIALFEVGHLFHSDDSPPDEPPQG